MAVAQGHLWQLSTAPVTAPEESFIRNFLCLSPDGAFVPRVGAFVPQGGAFMPLSGAFVPPGGTFVPLVVLPGTGFSAQRAVLLHYVS